MHVYKCVTGILLQSSDHSGVKHWQVTTTESCPKWTIQLGKNIIKEQIQPGAKRFKNAGKNLCSETLNFTSHHVGAGWLENTDVQIHSLENSSPVLNTRCSGYLCHLQPASCWQPLPWRPTFSGTPPSFPSTLSSVSWVSFESCGARGLVLTLGQLLNLLMPVSPSVKGK